jgi:hypothetical protein
LEKKPDVEDPEKKKKKEEKVYFILLFFINFYVVVLSALKLPLVCMYIYACVCIRFVFSQCELPIIMY